ncbi:hypothetical protein CEUSTIGMA_g7982.t1 [Chlamydomonas eustigma]|uniref:Uncharacterized protein n=1 Tax=Chlamydomonas eustigma TaxID=1157962 RepID=A0A250XBT4_9CHLO|nr:hypothetical protein CEUSTIGMA_g7982.t1 [Chlamydomonas eustigma]|eukprot:GAX80544.1 hypothetical protein CEUSTIGMA_g7982.t1 [Chlamydomonas eustigma]
MLIAPAEPFDLLQLDSPMSMKEDAQSEVSDFKFHAELEDRLQCAISVLKGCGHSVSAVGMSDMKGVLEKTLALLVDLVRSQQATHEEDMDAADKLRSDIKVVESARSKSEDRAKKLEKELRATQTQLQISEERHLRCEKLARNEKQDLQRQLLESKRRDKNYDHALRRKENEVDQLHKHVREGFVANRTCNTQHQGSDVRSKEQCQKHYIKSDIMAYTERIMELEAEVLNLKAEAQAKIQQHQPRRNGAFDRAESHLIHPATTVSNVLFEAVSDREYMEMNVPAVQHACDMWLRSASEHLLDHKCLAQSPAYPGALHDMIPLLQQSRSLIEQQKQALGRVINAYHAQEQRASLLDDRSKMLEASLEAARAHTVAKLHVPINPATELISTERQQPKLVPSSSVSHVARFHGYPGGEECLNIKVTGVSDGHECFASDKATQMSTHEVREVPRVRRVWGNPQLSASWISPKDQLSESWEDPGGSS